MRDNIRAELGAERIQQRRADHRKTSRVTHRTRFSLLLHSARRSVPVSYTHLLVEMIPHAKANKGVKYLMTIINAFSKYAYAVPMKTKTGVEVARALEPILRANKMKCLQTDNGKEYYNSSVQKLLSRYGITLYSTYSEKKASIVERFNRTLKTHMYRAFSEQGNYRWLDMLPKLVNTYNNSCLLYTSRCV